MRTLVRLLAALRKATLVRRELAIDPVIEAAGRLVRPTASPVKLVALTVPAAKLPLASRAIRALGVLALVALLAAVVALATAAAV